MDGQKKTKFAIVKLNRSNTICLSNPQLINDWSRDEFVQNTKSDFDGSLVCL